MNDTVKRFLWISVYAVAMAFLEAAVVAYIRALLQITEDHVSLGPYVRMETWREVTTIVMLVAVGWMAGRARLDRLAYGLFAFATWDIWYYVWLKVLLGWPETLLDWDILFLIPLRWWGPVLSPVLIALLTCVTAVLAVARLERGQRLGITPARGDRAWRQSAGAVRLYVRRAAGAARRADRLGHAPAGAFQVAAVPDRAGAIGAADAAGSVART